MTASPVNFVLGAVYGFIALSAGLSLARFGGAGAATALSFGAAVFLAFVQMHVLILFRRNETQRTDSLERMRADLARMTEELAEARAKADDIEARIRMEAKKRSEVIAHEIRGVEELIGRLGQSFEAQHVRRAEPAPDSPMRMLDPMLEAVREALNQSRVDLHLQPIVALPNRRIAFYEGFSRLRDESGRIIMPAEFLGAAEEAGLVSFIDNMLLLRCVQIVRKLSQKDRKIGIFCNVSINSLRDETFFPQFYEFLRQNSDLEGSLIFELGQSAFEARTSVEARNMSRLLDLGFRFSIDKVKNIEVDLADLERSGVRFFKVDASLLLHEIVDGGARPKTALTRDLAAHDVAVAFRRYGIEIIAEKIEAEKLVVEVLDYDIPYAQGHLFGAPRPVKGELLDEAASTESGHAPGRLARL